MSARYWLALGFPDEHKLSPEMAEATARSIAALRAVAASTPKLKAKLRLRPTPFGVVSSLFVGGGE